MVRFPGARQVTLSVHLFWLWVLGILAVGLVVAASLMGLRYAAAMSHVQDYGAMVRELEALRRQNVAVQELEAELRELRRLQQQLLRLAGIAPAVGPDTTDLALEEPASSGFPPGTHLVCWPVLGEVLRDFSGAHPALDIGTPRRRIILAAGEGLVVGADQDPNLGQRIVIQHGDSLETVYGNADVCLVAPGDRVRAGQVIALVGQGFEGALPHVHFQVLKAGRPVDPRDWVSELFPY